MTLQGLLTVEDLAAFGQFGQVVLEQPNITAGLTSHLDIDVELWGMHFSVSDVQLDRALTFNALNGLPNVTLEVSGLTLTFLCLNKRRRAVFFSLIGAQCMCGLLRVSVPVGTPPARDLIAQHVSPTTRQQVPPHLTTTR